MVHSRNQNVGFPSWKKVGLIPFHESLYHCHLLSLSNFKLFLLLPTARESHLMYVYEYVCTYFPSYP